MVINFLASYGYFGGGAFGNLFANLQQSGFFDYVLPFLLIFAVIYAILMKTSLFGPQNKSINAIISLAVSLMALQFSLVPRFFSEIFPQLGVGLVIVLLAVILLSVFSNETKNQNAQTIVNWVIFGIAALVFLVIVVNSLELFSWGWGFGGSFLYAIPWGTIIIVGAVVFAVWKIIKSGGGNNSGGGN